MKNAGLYAEQRLGNTDDASNTNQTCYGELLSCQNCEELSLRISLWKFILNGFESYIIASEMAFPNQHRQSAEILNTDYKTAEWIYRKIVVGSVPPSTLHEIVVDLLS